MRIWILITFVLLVGCAASDRSILTKEGDERLDCPALAREFEHAATLGDNAPARRRHIRALQKRKRCDAPPRISVQIGISKIFD
jgi:hypothetical protein